MSSAFRQNDRDQLSGGGYGYSDVHGQYRQHRQAAVAVFLSSAHETGACPAE